MPGKIRIGALISGGGTNLAAIMDACGSGEINGDIVFVGSDQKDARGLVRAKKKKIPGFVVDYSHIIKDWQAYDLPGDFDLEAVLAKQNLFPKNADPKKTARFFQSRAIAEAQIFDEMDVYPYDLLVLAGFMRILTPYFIDRVNKGRDLPRIMNIHPALLPSFPGVDGYGDTFAYGCKAGGCTVHFVDYGEDSGPIIGQKTYSIEPDDTEDSIREKGLELEWKLYPECVRLFAQNRLSLVVRGTKKVVEIANQPVLA